MSAPPQCDTPQRSHFAALRLLAKLGWQFLPSDEALALRGSPREVILKPRLIEVLQTRRFEYRGQRYPLSPGSIDQIVRQVLSLSLAEGVLAANERLYRLLAHGTTVTEFMHDGRKHQATIALLDWQDVGANRWDVTESLELVSTQGSHHRRLDIVAYVNGLPLAVIDTGRALALPGVDEGIQRLLQHQRPDEVPQLFAYAQLLLSARPQAARYGTTHTPAALWAAWREEEFGSQQLRDWKNRPLSARAHSDLLRALPDALRREQQPLGGKPLPVNEQDRLLTALMLPQRLLEFLRFFVLFDRKAGKVVARYQQFFAVRALLARLEQRRPDGAREGGVLWHTAGSGKSFTMVFLTKALLLHPSTQACRVMVVTDRLDLEAQLVRNFMSCGALGAPGSARKEGARAKVASGRELAQRIGSGTERIVFTLLHKFVVASKMADCHNPSADLVVLVDEGHRSHGGEAHERMRRVLPRAACVAFTGTPLLKDEKTSQRFGPIVHTYSLQRAVHDGTVVPLLYEERIPELGVREDAVDRWFERLCGGLSAEQAARLRRRVSSRQAVYGAAARHELIAWDIAQHFSEHFKRPGLGLKGQLATASKIDAIRYKRCLDATGLVSSAVVMSAPDTQEGGAEADAHERAQVQDWWEREVGRLPEDYERRVLQSFGEDRGPDLLIVVDRLLTGFDQPRNAVLYIDKPLKGHTLLQAVSRVNRLHPAKRCGLLVDYRGILKELDTAVRGYQDLATRTQGGFEIADIEGWYRPIGLDYQGLPALHQACWDCLPEAGAPRDAQALRQWLMPVHALDAHGGSFDTRAARREAFAAAVAAFSRCLQTALCSRGFFHDPSFSEAALQTYKQDLQRFTELRTQAAQDAAGPPSEQPTPPSGAAPLRRLLDQETVARGVREPQASYAVHRLGQPEARGTWTPEKARREAALVRTRLTSTIEYGLSEDAPSQQRFSALLKTAIEKAERLFDHPLKQYALLSELEARVKERQMEGMPESLRHHTAGRVYFSICRQALGEEAFQAMDPARMLQQVEEIDRVVRQALGEHSLNAQNIDAAVRQALLPGLFAFMGLERARAAMEQVLRFARSGLTDSAQ